jgi:hypothetical protein
LYTISVIAFPPFWLKSDPFLEADMGCCASQRQHPSRQVQIRFEPQGEIPTPSSILLFQIMFYR